MTIHVVGNVCVDLSFRLQRLPQPGETLNAAAAGEGVGGKGANQAAAAARTGADVVLWAPVGRDAASERVESLLATEIPKLDLTRLDLPCDRSVILIDRAGENVIVTAAACAEAFDPLAMTGLADKWAAGDMLLMQGNLQPAVTAACLKAARDAGLFTILNPSPLPAEPLDLTTVSLLVANRPEAEALTGEADAERAARRLQGMGAENVIVTLGAAARCLSRPVRSSVSRRPRPRPSTPAAPAIALPEPWPVFSRKAHRCPKPLASQPRRRALRSAAPARSPPSPAGRSFPPSPIH